MIRKLPGVGVVTGAASGIGRAVAATFIETGCTRIGLLDVDEKGLQETADKIRRGDHSESTTSPLQVETYRCDIASVPQVEQTFQSLQSDFGRVDYLVNCAGVNLMTPRTTEMSVPDFDLQCQVNCRGPWLCAREALKIMKEQSLDAEAYPGAAIPAFRGQRGSIVNISSVCGSIAVPSSPAYSASKAGVIGFTKCDALDYASDRIRVNAVLPGIINTAMVRKTPELLKFHQEVVAKRHTPMNRMAEPEEVADVAVFLSGNSASFVTGASWEVEGGFLSGHLMG